MTSFTVIKIIDGDSFEVSPNWKWNDQTGSAIRAYGYDTPEENDLGHQTAENKLTELILNKEVELKNPVRITYGRLLCNVYHNVRI